MRSSLAPYTAVPSTLSLPMSETVSRRSSTVVAIVFKPLILLRERAGPMRVIDVCSGVPIVACAPSMTLPLHPPLPPMEALSVDAIPVGEDWQCEPKRDGFRCLAFRDG